MAETAKSSPRYIQAQQENHATTTTQVQVQGPRRRAIFREDSSALQVMLDEIVGSFPPGEVVRVRVVGKLEQLADDSSWGVITSGETRLDVDLSIFRRGSSTQDADSIDWRRVDFPAAREQATSGSSRSEEEASAAEMSALVLGAKYEMMGSVMWRSMTQLAAWDRRCPHQRDVSKGLSQEEIKHEMEGLVPVLKAHLVRRCENLDETLREQALLLQRSHLQHLALLAEREFISKVKCDSSD